MARRLLALAAGVLIVSTAALLIRFAIDAGAGSLAPGLAYNSLGYAGATEAGATERPVPRRPDRHVRR